MNNIISGLIKFKFCGVKKKVLKRGGTFLTKSRIFRSSDVITKVFQRLVINTSDCYVKHVKIIVAYADSDLGQVNSVSLSFHLQVNFVL